MRRTTISAACLAWLVLALTAAGQSDVPIEPGFFGSYVYPIIQTAQCGKCHVAGGEAESTRVRVPAESASAEQIEAFGLRLAEVVDRARPEKSLLMNKPTNREEHTGGERIVPGSDEEKVWTRWVRYLATVDPERVRAASALVESDVLATVHRLRRLTHSQYNHTVRDLLGDLSRVADRFPPEDFVHGFKNQAQVQNIPPVMVEMYAAAAEKLAENAFRTGNGQGLIPCLPSSATDERCRAEFVRQFGMKAFRRPLSDAEASRYEALFDRQARSTGEFSRGAQIVVEAMLQSPKFLFHQERGPSGEHRAYEMASRLSYFLWDTMPDEQLFRDAADGGLLMPDGLERAARRMLADPRARQALDEFFTQWLRLDRVLGAVKDSRQYPEFTPELAATMVEETRRLLAELVWNDRNFMDAFRADYGYLNSELAALYGVPAPATAFDRVAFPAESGRAGILGQAAFLASTGKPAETSPTARGIFVREHLLCQQVPNPPPGVNANLPEHDNVNPRTLRQRLAEHVSNPACASCHKFIDPIGLGLEAFDTIGRKRDKEVVGSRTERVELEIDSCGCISGIPDSNFSSPRELGQILAKDPGCQRCVVKQLFRYAFGRLETYEDSDTIERSFEVFRDSGFRFQELIIALVKSSQFRAGLE
jgi:hypothetical protein